jgi:hypothetical protein
MSPPETRWCNQCAETAPPLQGRPLLEDSSWSGVEQWLRRGSAGGEMLLVFENTEDVLRQDQCAEVRTVHITVKCDEEWCAVVCHTEHTTGFW